MQLQREGKGWRTCPGAEEGRRIGRRAAAKLLLAILLDLSSNDAGTQQAHAWSVRSASAVRLRLRGGGGRGRGADVPRVPSEAVGVFAPHGLQLRPVKWPSEEARAKMSDGEDSDGSGAAAATPGGGDSCSSLDSGSSEAAAEDEGQSDTSSDADISPTVQAAQAQLWNACQDGDDKQIYTAVREAGADVNAHDHAFGGWTACHYAARSGRSRVMQILWTLGELKRKRHDIDDSAQRDHVSLTCPMTCDAGADMNARDDAGGTPLSLAAAEGHVSLVEKLVHHGAWVNASNKHGTQALHRAALNG